MTIAVTGATGYLGGAVHDILHNEGRDHIVVDREMTSVEAASVIHCAGRLRGRSPTEIWTGNVGTAQALLQAVSAETMVVMASSRAATRPDQDDYGLSKRRAEAVMAARIGPVRTIRFTVLAGPSQGSLGTSFLTRMVIAALKEGTVDVPLRKRAADLIDVREAAAVLIALAAEESGSNLPLDATTGPIDLWSMAETIVGSIQSLTGAHVAIRKVDWPESPHTEPAGPDLWHDTVTQLGHVRIPWETTVEDTVASLTELPW